MEYTNHESIFKRFIKKIKNSVFGNFFNSNEDIPSSDTELYKKICSEDGISIEEFIAIDKGMKAGQYNANHYLDDKSTRKNIKEQPTYTFEGKVSNIPEQSKPKNNDYDRDLF